VALVIRGPEAPGAEQLRWLDRARALARPAEAAVFGHGDPALARVAGAQGVHLRGSDLLPADARAVFGPGWIGVSVHDVEAGRRAFQEGADYLIAGNVFDTPTHPDRPGRGLEWLERLVRSVAGPVLAIGGMTLERLPAVRDCGAWGVAAISTLWDAPDPAATAAAMLEVLAT